VSVSNLQLFAALLFFKSSLSY